MKRTIKLIGGAITDGSCYAPIRFRAARLAATAAPKDYLGQARAVFNDFIKRWRYVRDPLDREMVVTAPIQIYETVMGGDNGRGHGDCDDATVAIGAQLAAIGLPVRIATIAPTGAPAGPLMSHVFAQTLIPGQGWVTVDPVVYPDHGFGFVPPHSRLVTWDLNGRKMTQHGNAQGLSGLDKGDQTMPNYSALGDIDRWQDYAGLGDYSADSNLPDFRSVGIMGFGAYAEEMGILPGLGLVAEVDTDENGQAWTPALEVAPQDYEYLRYHSTPYKGMLALGDNGVAYQYDSNLGFFRKLFRRIKKKVSSVAKKVLRKIPGGKYLLRLGSKVWKIAKKLVRPLMKFVGKYAAKLAPVAALIPGYGPAIAAGLYTAGRIAKLMTKYGVKLTGKGGKPRKLRFKSGKHAKRFQRALKRSAKALKQSKQRKYRARSRRLRISRPRARARARARATALRSRRAPSRRYSLTRRAYR